MPPQQSGADPRAPAGIHPQKRDQAAPSGTPPLKLWGIPVAGAAVLATLRAFRRRRVSRKKRRDELSTGTSAMDTARSQLRAAASLQGQPTSTLPREPSDPPAGVDGAPHGVSHPADATGHPSVDESAPGGTTTPPVDAEPPPEETTAPTAGRSDVIAEQRAAARLGGGQQRIDAQHARGKLIARERIERILDADTFEEIAPYVTHRHSGFGLERRRYAGDGVVTGFGRIDGRRVAIFAQDFTVLGGSFSEIQALKVGRLLESATTGGLPILGLLDWVKIRYLPEFIGLMARLSPPYDTLSRAERGSPRAGGRKERRPCRHSRDRFAARDPSRW